MVEKRLSEIDFAALVRDREFHPSPAAWEDQVLYFLMLDRFSDGREDGYVGNDGQWVAGSTPAFRPQAGGNAITSEGDAAKWRRAGNRFVGGTLKGAASKLGYLKRMGVTAIWLSPVFRQVPSRDSYHGYAIQNFLDVDPNFGEREDLRELVAEAHRLGIYVVLDVIVNHAGDVFAYDADRYAERTNEGIPYFDARWDGKPYKVKGYRNGSGLPLLPFRPVDLAVNPEAWPASAIWPAELQDEATFSRLGRITNWDFDPEFLEGDFETLKDIHLGEGEVDDFSPSPALKALCEIYKFWIAYADVDGFRIDTVKHIEPGAMRYFSSVINEFTQSIGKDRFYQIGEITGGRQRAFETLGLTGLNAALGIDDIPDKLEYLVKGWRDPQDYFSLFRNSELVNRGSHTWFRNKVVTMFDDHDQVRKGNRKARFCADHDARFVLLNALALNATTLGIPCIYYGSEQYFDGAGDSDRYIREAMFGGDFGAFRSRSHHFFNEDSPAYRELAKILAVRRERPALRRGRQYLRQISGDGWRFGMPELHGGEIRSVVAWSRLLASEEVVCAINTDYYHPRGAWVNIDYELHEPGRELTCLYSTDAGRIGTTATIEARGGKSVYLEIPAAGFVIYG